MPLQQDRLLSHVEITRISKATWTSSAFKSRGLSWNKHTPSKYSPSISRSTRFQYPISNLLLPTLALAFYPYPTPTQISLIALQPHQHQGSSIMAPPKPFRNTYEESPDRLQSQLKSGKIETHRKPSSRVSRDTLLRNHEAHLQQLAAGNMPVRNMVLPLPYPPARARLGDVRCKMVCHPACSTNVCG